jgi:hypothetical protein
MLWQRVNAVDADRRSRAPVRRAGTVSASASAHALTTSAGLRQKAFIAEQLIFPAARDPTIPV